MRTESIYALEAPLAAPAKGGLQRIRDRVVSALDAGAEIRHLTGASAAGMPGMGCLLADGAFQGKRHRVLMVEGAVVGGPEGERPEAGIRALVALRKAHKADAVFLCCGEGMPAGSLRSALKRGVQVLETDLQGRARIHCGRASIVRHVSVDDWAVSLSLGIAGAKGYGFDSRCDPQRLLYREKPLANWLCRTSRKLLRGVTEDCIVKARYSLKEPVAMRCGERMADIATLDVWYACRIRLRLHSSSAPLGKVRYDAGLKGMVALDEWEAEPARRDGGAPAEAPLLPAGGPGLKPDFHVYHPVQNLAGKGIPELDAWVESAEITVESGSPVLRL